MTKEKSKEMYERIVVIAIYMPNIVEIPFEEDSDYLLDQYREFLLMCEDIVRQEKNYRDIIIHNTCIYAIFDKKLHREMENVIEAARQIHEIWGNINQKIEGVLENLYFGIGVATGGAVKVSLNNDDVKWFNSIWLGKVLEDARSLAQMAFCDGRERVMVADTMFYDVG